MRISIIYQFESAQVAYRFMNSLVAWPVADVTTRLRSNGEQVTVSYAPQSGGFDRTASELDDLAERFGGHEVARR